MGTLVCFHAHPDDECIATGGVMAKAAGEGHRVVLVTATRGEHGEIQPGVLDEGEALWERRVKEVEDAARILGVARHQFLGYVDSGMMGTEQNTAPGAFWQADIDEAASRLAAILTEEHCDVLTVYDENGNYGHPDHIQVHRVGVRAAEMAGVDRVFEATMDRDRMRSLLEQARAAGELPDEIAAEPEPTMGTPAALITTRVDVTPWLETKRAAMRAHPSQISADSWFLTIPDEQFAVAFGEEVFVHRGVEPGGRTETDLFEGIA